MEYPYLQSLNDAQKEAVTNIAGPCLVIAGAGSGKTRVLTYRIAHLMRLGNAPSSILALTFTNKAAKEMKERISTIVGSDIARYLWMGTFHSIFARILRQEAEYLGFHSTFTIYDTTDSKSLIKTILKDMDLSDKVYRMNTVMGRISAAKSHLFTAEAYANTPSAIDYDRSIQMPLISTIYKEYTKRCKMAGAMDFDDLLLNTNLLFHNFPEVLRKYQDHFKYILVDEYQDTNYAQYLIIKNLAELNKNICVVGDDAQSIYSFRGARIENILNFKNDYPNYSTYKLEQNYRSTQNIVNAASSVICKNENQIHKEVFSKNEIGEKIKVIQAITDTEEAIIVAQEINAHRLTDHDQFEDYAILYRSNAQSRILEEELRKLNLPYKILKGLSFYERKEIKDMIAYLRLVTNSSDNEALKRIINYPVRGIGLTTLSKLEEGAYQNGKSIWDVLTSDILGQLGFNGGTLKKLVGFVDIINKFKGTLATSNAYEVALSVARETGLLEDLCKDKSPENLSKFENVQEILNAIQDFTINAQEEGRPYGLENYLEEVALLSDLDSNDKEDNNRITLMTIHSAKGLEFKNVFIVGVEDNIFPSNRSGFLSPESLEEERRLFYVALTRAEKRVWISFARQRYLWGQLNFCEPSRFIGEIDEVYLDFASNPSLPSFLNDFSKPKTGGNPFVHSNFKQVAPPVRRPISETNPQVMQKLTRLSPNEQNNDFGSANFDDLQPGMNVEHQRFGRGTILELEGNGPDRKAIVLFPNAGRKQMLLKFAKLKIVQ